MMATHGDLATRQTRRILYATACLSLAGLVWIFADRGRARYAVFDLQTVSDAEALNWSPEERPAWHRVDAGGDLASYRSVAEDMAGEGTAFQRATRLLARVAQLGSERGLDALRARPPIQTDDPLEVFEALRAGTRRGNCAHYSAAYLSLAQAAGIDARMVGLDGARWIDGAGHAMNEVYLEELGSWAVMDPQNHAFFADDRGTPLSLLELREHLLAPVKSGVHVVQGEFYTGGRDAKQTLEYYGRQIDRVVYNAHDDQIRQHRAIYSGWLARAVLLEKWPRLARRLLENTLWQKDSRVLYVDRADLAESFPERWVYRIAACLFGGSIFFLVLLTVWTRGVPASRRTRDRTVSRA